MNKTVTIKEGQSLEDLSLQIFGTVERVFDVMTLAGLTDVNSDNLKGITFTYEEQQTAIPSAIKSANYTLATKYPKIGGFVLRQDGGYLLRQDGFRFLTNE